VILNVCGLALAVSSEDDEVAAAVRDRLRGFPSASDHAPELRFEYRIDSQAVSPPPGEGRSVYDTPRGAVLHFAAHDSLYVDAGGGVRVLCDAESGRTLVSVGLQRPRDLWLLSRPMFTLPLLEMGKRRQRYGVHAAGVSVDGRGILLAGPTGAGKSTLALALAGRGLDFLGDDLVFLRRDDDGVRVLAFPDEIDVTDDTLRLLPELNGVWRRRAGAEWPKHRVAVAELPGVRVPAECQPAALLFPRVTDTQVSRLWPMSAHEALLKLAPNVLLTDPASSQMHLDALTQLVGQCHCARLDTGRDFDTLAERLRTLVAMSGRRDRRAGATLDR
jgi:hypothetical protein